MWSGDFSGYEIALQHMIQSMETSQPETIFDVRAYYRREILQAMDRYPNITPQELANRMGRAHAWVADLMIEAMIERKMEMLTYLVDQ